MIVVCLGAFAFVLWTVHRSYFLYDEWAFWIERRQLLHAHAYAEFFNREHFGHWIAIIMAVWAPLGALFGARSYLPYVIPTILVHCAAGFLLFELLVYVRIRSAVALGVAAVYLFLGSAAGTATFGWNICIVMPIACLYFGLLVVQRYADRGLRRYAALGALSVFTSIVSTGFGITVVLVVASAAFLRRRWMLGGGLLLGPFLLYFTWRHLYTPHIAPIRIADLGAYLGYTRSGIESVVLGVVHVESWFVAWVILASLITSIVSLFRQRSAHWSVFAVTLFGLLPFFALLSTQRFSAGGSIALRYLYFAGALLLPSFAALADRLWTTRRWMPIALALVVIWVLGSNARDFVRSYHPYLVAGQTLRREVASTVALGDRLEPVSGSVIPWKGLTPGLSVDVLRQLAAEDELPCDHDYPRAVQMARKLGLPMPPRSAVHCPS